MSNFSLSHMRNATPWSLYRMKEVIDLSPTYQREGGIWTDDKRRLLIDTIINRFDVPKIYLHQFAQPIMKGGKPFEYAVIDGKQRLDTLFQFIEGKFALDSDFEYLHAEGINASNMTYGELARTYPDLKTDFDSSALDVVVIQTDDIELIEEMFSRLNEAVPLNAAEKRNAKPGPVPSAVRRLSEHVFWHTKVPFPNTRYRHYDLAAKMLYIESRRVVPDTKKAYLDKFFNDNTEANQAAIESYLAAASQNLTDMTAVFTDNDGLLRSVGMLILYFHLFKAARAKGIDPPTRASLVEFEETRHLNRGHAENEITSAKYDLLEFDRYAQSPNDAIAIRYRLSVMDDWLYGGTLGLKLADADNET
jgi:hypothetical protein